MDGREPAGVTLTVLMDTFPVRCVAKRNKFVLYLCSPFGSSSLHPFKNWVLRLTRAVPSTVQLSPQDEVNISIVDATARETLT